MNSRTGCVWKVSESDRLCGYCAITDCGVRVLNGRKKGYVSGRMRKMDIDNKIVFGKEFLHAARQAAFRLAAEGKRFLVNNRYDGVHVERIK